MLLCRLYFEPKNANSLANSTTEVFIMFVCCYFLCQCSGHTPGSVEDLYNMPYHPSARTVVENDLLDGACILNATRASKRDGRIAWLKSLASPADRAVYRFFLLAEEVTDTLHNMKRKGSSFVLFSRYQGANLHPKPSSTSRIGMAPEPSLASTCSVQHDWSVSACKT
jgi:hypothetical protein